VAQPEWRERQLRSTKGYMRTSIRLRLGGRWLHKIVCFSPLKRGLGNP
jgi:hypothetical protein